MMTISATDVAIAAALKKGSLNLDTRKSRFEGETYVAICDEYGLIEVQPTQVAADERITAVMEAVL